jgi:acetyl-CoA carboxylase carboxyl transferase subunit alpha
MSYFDFEKPIEELEVQIENLKKTAEKNKLDLSASINDLQEKIAKTRNEIYANLSGWQRVQISRHPERPYALDYIEHCFTDFIEMHGDRNVKDDKAMIGGLARLGDQSVMVIGHQKGRNTKQRQYRNFGMPNPEGYRKALRLMKLAEKFNIPVITLIDTPGASPGLEAEERGQGEAIAKNLFVMSELKTPIICTVIGEGGSGGALALGVGDHIIMLQYSIYSVISPEGCASILWRSPDKAGEAAAALKLTAQDSLKNKLIEMHKIYGVFCLS